MSAYSSQVFLNVPFDRPYTKLLRALVFAVHDCSLTTRCALERDEGGEVRLDKIFDIIRDCRFGIHDLSRTTLDSANRLPRFNMPLELGVFLGARRYGDPRQREKSCLILDRDRYRYQKFCSDIAGYDIRAHGNQITHALSAVRNWLHTVLTGNRSLPSSSVIGHRYVQFLQELPAMCSLKHLTVSEVTFLDFRNLVSGWIDENPR